MSTNQDNIPYTYLIGWSKQKKYYYGVQFGKKSNPKNLWVIYFTSSRNVKKFREQYGEPDIIQIRKTFETAEKARLWETNVIQKMNLVTNTMWLNKTDNTSKFYFEGTRGPRSPEHTEKLRKAHLGKKISDEHKQKLHEGRRNAKNSIEHNNAISKASKGKKHTEESRKNMQIARMNIPKEERNVLASNAGKMSAKKYKEDTNRQIAHSERMKRWWSDRKANIVGSK